MEQNQYKRKYREMDDATKQKISDSLRNRSKSASHRTAISDGLKNYWADFVQTRQGSWRGDIKETETAPLVKHYLCYKHRGEEEPLRSGQGSSLIT